MLSLSVVSKRYHLFGMYVSNITVKAIITNILNVLAVPFKLRRPHYFNITFKQLTQLLIGVLG